MSVGVEAANLSPVVEDYLKAIYALSEGGSVGTSDLARELEVAPASATSMTKRLAEAGLLERAPYRGVALTEIGRRAAVSLIRRHRLIELFLNRILGIEWDRVHEEAERWEHVVSREVEGRIDRLLDYPSRDPHGAPIPTADLVFEESIRVALASLDEGQMGTVTEVDDTDPALLRYVGSLGLYPGVRFEVVEGPPFEGGPLVIRLSAGSTEDRIIVDGKATASVFIEAGVS